MPSKFDQYLKKGDFTDQDREALQGEKAQTVDRPAPPPAKTHETPQPNAPQPSLDENSKERIEGMEEVEGNNYQEQSESNSLTKDSLAQYEATHEKEADGPELEQEKEKER